MPFSYPTSLPTNGQPRVASQLATLYSYINTWASAHINNLTPADQHDTNAIINHGSLGAFTSRALTASTQHFWNDMFAKAFSDIIGAGSFTAAIPTDLTTIANAIAGHTIIAASAATATTATTANAVPASGITGTVSINAISADFKVIPNAALLTVTVNGGAWVYPSGLGNVIAPQNVALATAPGANSRYDTIYIDTNGVAHAVTGTVAPSPVAPAMPTGAGNVMLAQVLVFPGQSILAVPANQINDFRALGGSISGGTGTLNSTVNYLTGTDQSSSGLPNSKTIASWANSTSGFASGSSYADLKLTANSASLADALNGVVSSSIATGILTVSGGTATLQPNNLPVFVNKGTDQRIFLTSTAYPTTAGAGGASNGVATASGAAALWDVCADFGPTGPNATLTLIQHAAAHGGNLVVLYTVWWDGATTLVRESIVPVAMPIFGSGNYAPITFFTTDTQNGVYVSTVANQNVYGAMPGNASGVFPIVTKYFSGAMRGSVTIQGEVIQASTATDLIIGLRVNGLSIAVPQFPVRATDLAAGLHREVTLVVPLEGVNTVSSGGGAAVTFQPYLYVASSQIVSVTNFSMYGKFYT